MNAERTCCVSWLAALEGVFGSLQTIWRLPIDGGHNNQYIVDVRWKGNDWRVESKCRSGDSTRHKVGAPLAPFDAQTYKPLCTFFTAKSRQGLHACPRTQSACRVAKDVQADAKYALPDLRWLGSRNGQVAV